MQNLPLYLVAAHLVGDFLLQNDAMARDKARCSLTCIGHVGAYLAPFTFIDALPFWAWAAIGAQHFLQDRFALHLRWMRFYGQTPPDRWPTGPICVDQAMHIGFIAVVAAFI